MEEAVALSAEQLMTNLKTSFGGVYETIVHLYQSDRIWLDRLEERPSGKFEDYTAPGCVWELSDAWAEVQQQLIVLTSGLREADMDRPITYRNLAGQTFSSPIWQILLHVVNHGTHHRGQVTAMIRSLAALPRIWISSGITEVWCPSSWPNPQPGELHLQSRWRFY